ncbi:MAG: heavy-metal-associated domain-containing protein [Chloroflexaceae bacterium]|jgi:copper ion binding protein|nr:heavy-metal-associated domain-containing protein [Chloroflexaceae bacterium]
MAVEQFRVPEMSCQHCVRAVTKEVSAVPGVQNVQVELSNKTVRVEHDGNTNVSTLIHAINEAGYTDVSVLV